MIYVSIDIETTGLDRENDQVLEIGAVIEDTDKQLDFEEIPKYKAILNHERLSGSVYALNLNARILNILASIPKYKDKKEWEDMIKYTQKHNILSPHSFALSFHTFLTSHIKEFDTKISDSCVKVVVAGKNFGSFDKVFLEKLPQVTEYISFGHRSIDPANLYLDFENDKNIPSLNECLNRADINDEVTHDALLDAWDVVRVLREKY